MCIQDHYCYDEFKDRHSSAHSQLEDVELESNPAYEEVPQPSPPANLEHEYEEYEGSATDIVVQNEQNSFHSQIEDVELEPNPAYKEVPQHLPTADLGSEYVECGGSTTDNDDAARNEQSGVHSQFEDVQLELNPAYGMVLQSAPSADLEPQYVECGGSATDPSYQLVARGMQTAAQMEEEDYI